MAFVSSKISEHFPHFVTAVSELRHIKTVKPKVFKAFMAYSGMNEDEAFQAMYPWKKINEVLWWSSEDVSPKYVLDEIEREKKYATYQGSGNNIDVQGWFLVLHNLALNSNISSEKKKSTRLLMESKLLHEMVHWARPRKGLIAGSLDPDGDEKGWKFEQAAYNMRVTGTSLGLQDYID